MVQCDGVARLTHCREDYRKAALCRPACLRKNHPFVVLIIFLAFMLLHQADKSLIGQVLEDVQHDFGIDDAAVGASARAR